MDSILTSIKQMLGIEASITHFDPEVTIYINSTFMTLSQLGVGPENGFIITGASEKWVDFLGQDTNLEAVKTYTYIKVRLIFDPPSSPAVIEAMQRSADEAEWRICAQADKPIPEPVVEEVL